MDSFDLTPPDNIEPPPSPALMGQRRFEFRGKALYPYSFPRRLVVRAVLDGQEPESIWTLGLLYVLTLPNEEIRALLFKPKNFREPFLVFVESCDMASYKEAVKIVDDVLAEVRDSKVEVEAAAEDPLKLKKNP